MRMQVVCVACEMTAWLLIQKSSASATYSSCATVAQRRLSALLIRSRDRQIMLVHLSDECPTATSGFGSLQGGIGVFGGGVWAGVVDPTLPSRVKRELSRLVQDCRPVSEMSTLSYIVL